MINHRWIVCKIESFQEEKKIAPNPTLAELREKKKENEAYLNKIIQRTNALGNSIRAQEKNLNMYDRKERTHRLCTRGGMLESFLRDPNALTNDQVMNLLRVCFRQNPVQEALNQMLEDAYSGRSESTT